MPSSQERFNAFKAQRRNISPLQGTGEEEQTAPSTGTTGLGAIAGGVGVGLLTSRFNPLASESAAAAGAALGDLSEAAIQQALDPQREVTLLDSLLSAGKEAAGSFIGGGVGRGATKAFSKAKQFGADKMSFLKKEVTAESQVVVDTIDSRAHQLDIPSLTVAERTEDTTIDFLANIAKNSILGAKIYKRFLLKRDSIFGELADEYGAKFGANAHPTAIGKIFTAIQNKNKRYMEVPAVQLRNQVQEGAQALNLNASIDDLRQFAKGQVEKSKRLGGIGDKRQGANVSKQVERATQGDPTVESIAELLANSSKTKSVTDLIEMRSSMLDVQRSMRLNKKLKNSPAAIVVGNYVSLLNESIESGLRASGDPALLHSWKESNRIFSKASNQFADKLADNLLQSARNNPAGLSKAIMSPETQNSWELVRKAKKILLPENIKNIDGMPVLVSTKPWKRLQSSMMNDILTSAYDLKIKKHSGGLLLQRLASVGDKTLEEAFGKQTTQGLKQFSESLAFVQKKEGGLGSLGIQFVQFGVIVGLTSFDLDVPGGAVLLGPIALAKILTSRKGVDLLTKGLKTKITDPRWPAIAARIAGMATAKALNFEESEPTPQQTSSASAGIDLTGGIKIVQ